MDFRREGLLKTATVCFAGLLLQAVACSNGTIQFNQQFKAQVASSSGVTRAAEDAKAKKSKTPVAGDVLIAGGVSGTKSTAVAQFYDPTTKKWTKTGSMTIDRAAPCGVPFGSSSNGNQFVLVAGGAQVSAKTKGSVTITMTPLNSAEQYDPTTGTFTALTNTMTAPRAGCTATELPGGKILIAGGLDSSGNPQTSAEIFDPTVNPPTFTATGSMSSPRAFQTATLLNSGPLFGDVLISGGLANDNPNSGEQGQTLNTAEIYDPATGTFSPAANAMSDYRGFHTATLLNDGTVLVAGGISNGFPGAAFGATASADIFSTSTDSFSPTASPMIEPLALQGATPLNDGTVLISGGFDADQVVIFNGGAFGAFFGSVAQGAEIYTPSSQAFACIGGTTTVKKTQQTVCASTMRHPHAGHAAVLLNDGTVLIAGGFGGSKDTSDAKTTKVAEIYNATAQTFTKVGAMKTGVALGEAVVINPPPV